MFYKKDFRSTYLVKPAHFMSNRFLCSSRQATQYSEILVVGCKLRTLQGKKRSIRRDFNIYPLNYPIHFFILKPLCNDKSRDFYYSWDKLTPHI